MIPTQPICYWATVSQNQQIPRSRVQDPEYVRGFAVSHSTFSCCRCHISGRQSKHLWAPANNLEYGPNHLLSFFSSHSPILMAYFFRMLVSPVIQQPILIHICSALSPFAERAFITKQKNKLCSCSFPLALGLSCLYFLTIMLSKETILPIPLASSRHLLLTQLWAIMFPPQRQAFGIHFKTF